VDAGDDVGHLCQRGVHVTHDVLAVDHHRFAHRAAQGGVQHGTVFRGVDALAVEHGASRLLDAGLAGQIHQQGAGFGRDEVLRVVEKQAAAGNRQIIEARRVGLECFAHAEVLHGQAVFFQGLPGRQAGDIERMLVVAHGDAASFALTGR